MRRSNYATRPHRTQDGGETFSSKAATSFFPTLARNQAIASMPDLPRVEIAIPKENQDLIVLQTFPAKVSANLPGCDSGNGQYSALTVESIFIENDQAWTRSPELSVVVYSAE
jgi:hypothetical protein